MSDIDNQKLVDDFEKVKAKVERVHRNTKWMSFISLGIGAILAYVFNHLNSSTHFVSAIMLYSQMIGFGAAILLSSQFMDIPEKLYGIHNYATALVMSLPMYIWLSSFMYSFVSIFGNFQTSEVWGLVVTITGWGLGVVLFGFGSVQEALKFEISDKALVVGIGWYMVLFSLGLQVYLSLISLEVLKVPFAN